MSSSPAVPMYHQIYLVLREQIAEGQFADGRLPVELELARQFGASRITMRKALERLVTEGTIIRRRGSGSFVKQMPKEPKKTHRVGGLLEDIINLGLKSKAKVLELNEIGAPSEVADLLGLTAGDPVLKVIRLRSYQNKPLSHMTTYVPRAFAGYLKPSRLESKPMLTLLEEAGIQVGTATQIVSARLADSKVAAALDVEIGAPLLFVQRVVTDVKGQAVQLLRGLYRPDRYEYRMELSRVEGDKANLWMPKEIGIDFGHG